MLKLKRVEIQGFKSFYDKTEMKFTGNGIAAVVGPNGCGKSNLSDAISWVLGEQSAKSLRGARMEDVIFAGTRDRKPLGMASVTLTLVPDERILEAVTASIPEPPTQPVEASVAVDTPESENSQPVVTETVETEEVRFASQNGQQPSDLQVEESASLRTEIAAVKTVERMGEVTITRRLYRSGESEYLINGRTGRLRDIQDLFLGTGLGPESYAIIEQGRIGQILSNRPQDRRGVIEEAAGVTKFKTRKRLAEAKLEGAKQNLSRVFDILEEVNRQVNSLRRQAAKTKRYTELAAEAKAFLEQVLVARFRVIERDLAKTAIDLNMAGSEVQKLQTSVAEREQSQTATLEISYATEQKLTETRQQLADLQLEAERTRGKHEYQLKQAVQMEQRIGNAERESEELGRQQQASAVELEQHTAEAAALTQDVNASRQQLDSKNIERQRAHAIVNQQQGELEAARQQVMRLMGECSSLKNRITQVEVQLSSADRETQRAAGEEKQATSDLDRIYAAKKEVSERLSNRQTELTSVADQRRDVDRALGENRRLLGETRQTLDRLRSDYSRVKARRDSLAEILSHRTYTTETVKRLFTAVERGKGSGLRPLGVLADFLEVDPQYEKATEEFLHEELEYVVVHQWQDGEQGIDLLRRELEGRATFLVETASDASHANTNSVETEKAPPDFGDGVVARLADVVRLTNGLTGLSAGLPARLKLTYFAESRETAQRLSNRFPDHFFLTNDGVSYHGQTISGGKKSGAGPLALKRELRELDQLEKVKATELAASQKQLNDYEQAIQKLAEQGEQLRTRQQAQEKDVLALDYESRKLGEELQRVNSRLSNAKLELDRLSRNRVHMEASFAQDREALGVKESALREQEQALNVAREHGQSAQTEVTRLTEEHATMRADLASLEERLRSSSQAQNRLESRVRDFGNRRDHLRGETARLTEERINLLKSNGELDSVVAELAALIAAADTEVRELSTQESDLRARLGVAEEELKALRALAQTAHEKRADLQVLFARLESDNTHLEETCQKELQTNLADLSGRIENVPDPSELAGVEAKHNDVRRKIDALGPVNPEALEEFEDAQQRQEFLNAQRQDLLDSIRDTERAIQDIDVESKKRFGEAFHAINANFRELFQTLFGGGTGEMRLTDEDNLSDSGIDIVASPPGKRLQSVLLLSGGEKSLTAMALLMAIFNYTPSPFCILDEVDAPLDEPNTERLTRLLKEMAEQTQFIVITHSKRTMEAAQSLYGVTMQEPGVSKLVSVKFKGSNGDQSRSTTSRQHVSPQAPEHVFATHSA